MYYKNIQQCMYVRVSCVFPRSMKGITTSICMHMGIYSWERQYSQKFHLTKQTRVQFRRTRKMETVMNYVTQLYVQFTANPIMQTAERQLREISLVKRDYNILPNIFIQNISSL